MKIFCAENVCRKYLGYFFSSEYYIKDDKCRPRKTRCVKSECEYIKNRFKLLFEYWNKCSEFLLMCIVRKEDHEIDIVSNEKKVASKFIVFKHSTSCRCSKISTEFKTDSQNIRVKIVHKLTTSEISKQICVFKHHFNFQIFQNNL